MVKYSYLQCNSAAIPHPTLASVTVTVISKRKNETSRSITLWLIKYQLVSLRRKILLLKYTIRENKFPIIPEK